MKKQDGFTLIELLVVIVIIMLLVGLLMPALHGTQKQSRNKKSKAECMAIQSAILAYKMDKGEWPLANQGTKDEEFGEQGGKPNANIIDKLKNENPPYLDIGDFRTDNAGNVLTPWKDAHGKDLQYIIKIDADYDGYWHGKNSGTNYEPMASGVEVSSPTNYPLSKYK